MLNQKIFRERDICGIADSDLPGEDVEILGKALASYLIRYSGRIICVGRDARESSSRLHAALLKGLVSAGAHVLDIDVVPTPVLYHSVIHVPADAAIMITGGNESPEHNGFKIVCGASLLFGHALEEIYKVIQIADFEVGDGNVKQADAARPYIEELISQFQFPRTVKLAFEAGHGAVGPLVQQLLKGMKASVVKRSEAAVSLSISSDADRLTVADEKGKPVSPEMLLLLFGREILTRKPESVLLYDERFPETVVRKLLELGGKPIALTSSEPPVQARIKHEHAELSVQADGQIVFSDRYYGFEDAIYAACRLLEMLTRLEGPLSAVAAGLAENASLPV